MAMQINSSIYRNQPKLLQNLKGISAKIDTGLNNLKIHKTKNVNKIITVRF